MGWRVLLVLGLTGCGLTLNLDEPVDASEADASPLVDVPSADAGGFRDGAFVEDVALPDSALVDAGFDAPFFPCEATCPPGQACSAGMCVDLCGGAPCFEGQVCVAGACVRDCGICPAGHQCGAEGRCVCENECGVSERCSPEGVCEPFTCEEGGECASPLGEGCAEFRCEMGTCVPLSTGPAECSVCDPLTGEDEGIDSDGDGFVVCDPDCMDEPEDECDCDDDNPFINPDAFDVLSRDRNCDGEVDADPLRVCVEDGDMDGAYVVRPLGDDECVGDTLPIRILPAVLSSLPRLDCNDDNALIYPRQQNFFASSINGSLACEAGRGECYDYNCDSRQEREYPIFAQCSNVRVESRCEEASGWRRASGPVPPCGSVADFIRCEWSEGLGCRQGRVESARQRCR